MEDASLPVVTDGVCTEDTVLKHEGDADDKVRVLPKTSFACFRMGAGEPAARAPGALADIDRWSAVSGAQARRYGTAGTESAGKSDCTCNFI